MGYSVSTLTTHMLHDCGTFIIPDGHCSSVLWPEWLQGPPMFQFTWFCIRFLWGYSGWPPTFFEFHLLYISWYWQGT